MLPKIGSALEAAKNGVNILPHHRRPRRARPAAGSADQRRRRHADQAALTRGTCIEICNRVWVFDLDNTLHNASPHIFPHINRAMTAYVQTHLGLDETAAGELRRHYWQRYGATLIGLMRHHATDPQHFLRATHQFPDLRRMLVREPALRATLSRLPGRKIVFSNAPVHYAAARARRRSASPTCLTMCLRSSTPATGRSPTVTDFCACSARHRVRARPLRHGRRQSGEPADRQAAGHEDGVGRPQRAALPAYVDFSIRSLLQLPRAGVAFATVDSTEHRDGKTRRPQDCRFCRRWRKCSKSPQRRRSPPPRWRPSSTCPKPRSTAISRARRRCSRA